MATGNGERPSSSRRDENSLYSLTKKFLELLKNSSDRHINMKVAADKLNVGKRRIYDVTNVLDGLGMVSKWSVNSVKWTGQNIDECLAPVSGNDDWISAADDEEAFFDSEIQRLNREITEMSRDEDNLENAYVTYSDLLKLGILKNKMVFALKAPNETTVEYPRYEKGHYKLTITNENGDISLFYISKEG